jgi:hypothetical protein
VLNPNEVVLPDTFQNPPDTLDKSKHAMRVLERGGYPGQYMVVPHGTDLEEYLTCAKQLADLGTEVKTIGVIEEVQQILGPPREDVIAMVKDVLPDHDIHMLGVTEGLTELMDPWVQQNVRSCDTAKFVVWGLNGITVVPKPESTAVASTWPPPYPGRKSLGGRVGYFDHKNASTEAIKITQRNITAWKEYLCAAS